MGYTYCATCDGTIQSNGRRYSVTYGKIRSVLFNWATQHGKTLDNEMEVCQGCYLKCVRVNLDKTGTKRFEVKSKRKPARVSVPSSGWTQDLMSQVTDMDWGQADSQTNTPASSSNNFSSQQSFQSGSTQSSSGKSGVMVHATIKTQSQCCICKSSVGRMKVPASTMMDMWIKYNTYIPAGNRTCAAHLDSTGKFTSEAVQQILLSTREIELTCQEVAEFIESLTVQASKPPTTTMKLSFAEDSSLTDDQYKMLTGIERWMFDNLFTYCQPHLRTSCNRCPRDCLAIFLMKLRLDVSQEVLAFLFDLDHQARVSEIISHVVKILTENFVDKFLGYGHLAREQLISDHTPQFVKHVLNASEESAILVMDGTYLYIEKSSNLELQKKTFSMYKLRNLIKPMMVVAADGYIIHVEGPYFGDGENNDASILKKMLHSSEFRHYVIEDDELVLDRGFRDAISEANLRGLKTTMPNLLGKKVNQFTAIEANDSRKVTMIRWVVESVNGRIKNVWKFFKNTIPITYLPKLGSFFKIACAISNAYFPPLVTDRPEHKWIAEEVLRRAPLLNTLQAEVEPLTRKEASWELVTAETLPNFPYLTLEDLKRITLGCYQINMAPAYSAHHIGAGGKYKIYVHRENESLIRAKIESRFQKKKKRVLWIELDNTKFGYEALTRWYCACPVGARLVGTCSHVTSVLWYLGHGRFISGLNLPNQSLAVNILNARQMECDSSDDEFGFGNI